MKLNLAGGVTAALVLLALGQPLICSIEAVSYQGQLRNRLTAITFSQLDRVIADLDALVQAVGLKAA